MKISVFYDHIIQAAEQSGEKIPALLKKARAYGIEAVEINYTQLMKHRFKILFWLKRAGLDISCIYEFYDWGNTGDIAKVKGQIDMAKKTGADRILVIPGFLQEDEAKELNHCHASFDETKAFMEQNKSIQKMKKALCQVTAYAKEKGIKVTLEDFDLNTAPFSRMYQLKWFMENVPDLYFTLDTGNFAYSDEDVLEAYELLKKHIVHVHCKDRKEDREAVSVHNRGMSPVAAGDGYIPIAELIKELKKQGYDGYLAMEHFDAPNQIETIKRSAMYLNQEKA